MKQSKINLNDTVRFKLTDFGKDIYYHQFDELNEELKTKGISPFKPEMPKVDADGFTSMQLWCFIELYGSHIGMARPNVIEPLDIYFEEKTEN